MKIWLLMLGILAAIAISTGCISSGDSNQVASELSGTSGRDQVLNPTATVPPLVTGTTRTITIPTEIISNTFDAVDGESLDGQLAAERCGIRLPLVAIPTEPSNAAYNGKIPADLLPTEALPALERLVSDPESVALVAYEIGRESEGVYHNADQAMPLASVVKIINLVAYAEAVEEGLLDPADWISLDELNKTYLPGSDLGAHSRALEELEQRGLIGRDPPSIPLEEVPWMMIRHSSNAASDYIHLTLGQDKIESTAINLGLTRQSAPCPWIGQFLIMHSKVRVPKNDRAFVQEMIADPEDYGREVMRLAQAFSSDPNFRQAETSQRWRSNINTQRLFSENLNSQGTAQEYADLMAKILGNGLSSPYVNILTRRALEWPTELPANQEHLDVVGYKNGSLPGILTTVYYGQRREDGAQVVVAIFFRDLPMNLYRSWRQSLPHDELSRWLMTDKSAIQILNQYLNDE